MVLDGLFACSYAMRESFYSTLKGVEDRSVGGNTRRTS